MGHSTRAPRGEQSNKEFGRMSALQPLAVSRPRRRSAFVRVLMKTRQHVSYRWFLLAAISATALAMPTAHSQPVDEPVPLRRIWLDPERLPDEMKRVRLGVLKQLPLADFEALIRRAGRATAALKEPVRLIEARYRATLIDTALVGTGQWTINNPGSGARILALDPLNLAPRQPRFENRDALLADFEGGKPGLLVDETGRHSLALDWTARCIL